MWAVLAKAQSRWRIGGVCLCVGSSLSNRLESKPQTPLLVSSTILSKKEKKEKEEEREKTPPRASSILTPPLSGAFVNWWPDLVYHSFSRRTLSPRRAASFFIPPNLFKSSCMYISLSFDAFWLGWAESNSSLSPAYEHCRTVKCHRDSVSSRSQQPSNTAPSRTYDFVVRASDLQFCLLYMVQLSLPRRTAPYTWHIERTSTDTAITRTLVARACNTLKGGRAPFWSP